MKIVILLILSLSLLFVACQHQEYLNTATEAVNPILAAEIDDSEYSDVGIVVSNNGISEDASRVNVSNMYAGARAEVIFAILNESQVDINPSITLVIDVNPSDYDVAKDYCKPPAELVDWLTIPDIGTIKSGEYRLYTVVMEIPENTEFDCDRWAFKTECSGGTGGRVQTAVGLWWLIDMR